MTERVRTVSRFYGGDDRFIPEPGYARRPDPNQPHPFGESHLNTACVRCAQRRHALIHTQGKGGVSLRRILADNAARHDAAERERRAMEDMGLTWGSGDE